MVMSRNLSAFKAAFPNLFGSAPLGHKARGRSAARGVGVGAVGY
jgi:hypothetical protein